MNKNNTIITTLLIIIIALLVYISFRSKIPSTVSSIIEEEKIELVGNQSQNSTTNYLNLTISSDKKSIVKNGQVVLSVDNDAIFNFFKDPKIGMCDENNINNTKTRQSFCTSKTVLKSKTRFSSIASSQDGNKIVFTIMTDELEPDTLVGIFYPLNTTYKIHFLTNFGLGNEFIGFSPSGTNLAYKSVCWEGICRFSILNAATLESKVKFKDDLDAAPNRTFIRFITDNKVEYKEGDKIKQVSF